MQNKKNEQVGFSLSLFLGRATLCFLLLIVGPVNAWGATAGQVDTTKILWSKTGGPKGAKMIDLAINPENTNIIG